MFTGASTYYKVYATTTYSSVLIIILECVSILFFSGTFTTNKINVSMYVPLFLCVSASYSYCIFLKKKDDYDNIALCVCLLFNGAVPPEPASL